MSEEKKQSAYDQLPAKRRKFVDEYVKDCNGTQAAIRAGYSPKSANEQSAQLLAILSVKSAVDEKLAEIAKKNEISAEWVIDKAKKIIERCMQAEPVYDREGYPTGEYQFDAAGANGSLKILAKYLGMEKSTVSIEGQGLGIVLHLNGKLPKPGAKNGSD
jgi:phage terminase small subunit